MEHPIGYSIPKNGLEVIVQGNAEAQDIVDGLVVEVAEETEIVGAHTSLVGNGGSGSTGLGFGFNPAVGEAKTKKLQVQVG